MDSINSQIPYAVFAEDVSEQSLANDIAERLHLPLISSNEAIDGNLYLKIQNGSLCLTDGSLSFSGDFSDKSKRLSYSNLSHELLIKAVKIKGRGTDLNILDATAGMGEDSILLAAYGFDVTLFEYNPYIAELLRDTLRRSQSIPALSSITERMHLNSGDSVSAMREMTQKYDVVFLDPMFPERQKTSLVKKKFQLIHKLEQPCANEKEMLDAALNSATVKVVVKRPAKGPYIANAKPNYSIEGNSIRYDCYLLI